MSIWTIIKWFMPEEIGKKPEKLRRARYFIITYSFLIVLILFYMTYYLFTNHFFQFCLYTGSGLYALLSLYLVKKKGWFTTLSNIGVGLFSGLLWTQVFLYGGIYSPHLYWISLVPILSFLLTGPFYGIIWSSVTISITLVLFFIELGKGHTFMANEYYFYPFYYLKSILPFFAFLFVIILTYEKSKLKDITSLELANRLIEEKKRLVEVQNEKMVQQHHEIVQQRDQLSKHQQEIIFSLQYAHRIQNALLPSEETLHEFFDEHFVLNLPRDIVSGDFYWTRKIDHHVIIAVADCTGHGVPGAFMSLMGTFLLSEIVVPGQYESAAHILNCMREKVKQYLKQTGKRDEQKDGMDMALCILNRQTHHIQYAGAHNPIYLIRDSRIIEFKAGLNQIGADVFEEIEFSNQELSGEKGDILYLFSDGYFDQVSEKNKKFLRKNFKRLLIENSHLPLSDQRQILNDTFQAWRNNTPQVDDILILGIKI